MSKPKFPCIRKMALKELAPNEANPRRITAAKKEKLQLSLKELGNLSPVTFNVRTGKLVGGHKRVELLIESGETETDVWCIDLAPAKEKAALLALNTHSGEWDEEKLQAVLKDLEGSAFDAEFFDLAEALKNEPTKIEEIQILPAPRFAWVLIGVPIVQFSKVQAVLDKMPAEAIIKTTANDGPKEEQCSEENIPTE